MRTLSLAAMALLGMTALTALAQAPPIDPATGARPGHEPGIGESLPRSLPPSAIGEDATTNDYLRSARASLVAGRTGEAQQSLEMAQTRALDRSVVQGQGSVPDGSLLVSRIYDARRALGGGDNTYTIRLVDLALSN